MPLEDWDLAFRASLVARAHALAAELGPTNPDAEPRGRSFEILLVERLYCPECWVRHGRMVTLHRARWLMSCGEHDYKVD